MKKVDDARAIITAHEGDKVQLKLIDSLDVKEAVQRRYEGKYYAYLSIVDPHTITDLQRKHYFALVGDVAEYTGYPNDAVDSYLRYQFMKEESLDEYPSVARGMMDKTTASKLIEFVINFCIVNEIPFRKQQFYLTTDTNKMQFALTMRRLCVVCGKPHSDIHHATNLVGMGNDRGKHDHLNSTFLSLCREHHNEVHNTGLDEFCSKYFVKPIKLNYEHLKILGVM